MYTNEKLAVYKEFLNGKTASVIGVGISNIPLIDFLLKNGAAVVAYDEKNVEALSGIVPELSGKGVELVFGEGAFDFIPESVI